MNRYSINGYFIKPELINNKTYNRFMIFLTNKIFVCVYTSFNLVQLISLITENNFNMIYDELGQMEMISRKHIIKIKEVND